MKTRVWQIILIATMLISSWLMMQVVHEWGHVVGAWISEGQVTRVVLHPLVISRTDLGENPHPLIVVWSGPLVGSLLPLLIFGLANVTKSQFTYLFRFVAGFCLVANGAYIGTGAWLADESDCRVMLDYGSPLWILIVFGAFTIPLGLYLWHRQGRSFGLGADGRKIKPRDAILSAVMLCMIIAVELLYWHP